MMKALLILLVACTIASASNVKKVVKTQQVSYQAADKGPYIDRAVYNGAYSNKCDNDGFYHNDASSFVICSNGNAYIQPCAPGSKNSVRSNYQHGSSYSYRDFCDVNLVDDGYTLRHGAYNTGHNAGYGNGAGYGNAGYANVAGYGNAGHGNAGYGPAATGHYTAFNDGSVGYADNIASGSYQKVQYGSYGYDAQPYDH